MLVVAFESLACCRCMGRQHHLSRSRLVSIPTDLLARIPDPSMPSSHHSSSMSSIYIAHPRIDFQAVLAIGADRCIAVEVAAARLIPSLSIFRKQSLD